MLSRKELYLLITAGVAILVIFLPIIDRIICSIVGLNLGNGLSRSKHALQLRKTRAALIDLILIVYLSVVAWLVFFSRTEAQDFEINTILLNDLRSSEAYSTGILGALWNFAQEVMAGNITSALKDYFSGLSGIYLNIVLFIPLGYLLPYASRYFRRHSIWRPTICGFLLSVLIENLQLVTKHGFYDVDDIICNTLGALIGCLLYKIFAYFWTHPQWKRQLKLKRRWRKHYHTALTALDKHTNIGRMRIYASDREEVTDFYLKEIGFRPDYIPQQGEMKSILLKKGSAQLEIVFTEDKQLLKGQTITLYGGDIDDVRRKLNAEGIDIIRTYNDSYEHRACLETQGPDGVKLIWIS